MSATALYCGTDPERQSVGLPGHCDRCAEIGHVRAHRSLGCGDVGCNSAHGSDEPADRAPSRTDLVDREIRDLANTIALQADAIAAGTVIGPRVAAVRCLLANVERLAAITPDDRA